MRAFYAIVEEGNISHAAQRLDIAQPALSRQMKRLETQLGVQLFERGSRRIRLTDAGRVLYSRVEHILGMVDGTVREITEIGSGVAGCIRLGTITTSGAMLLPELITEFHRRYPQVTFQLWEGEGTRILEPCRTLGFAPNILAVSDSIVQELLLAKMGMGMAILPISSKTLLTDGDLTYKKLVEPEITTHTVVAWLKNRTLSQSASHLIALFREMFLS